MDLTDHKAGMGGSPGIPLIERAGLADVVLNWAADPSICHKEISRRLQDEYGVSISGSSVSKWLAKNRDDRRIALAQKVATDPALAERMGQHLTTDLDIVDEILHDLASKYRVVQGIESKVDLARALFDGLRTKAKLMGADGAGSAASAVAAVVAVGGASVGRLRDLTEAELGQLLTLGREHASALEEGGAASRGPEGVPEDEGGVVPGGPEEARTDGLAREPEASSTEGRTARGAGDTDGSPRQ